ncbi:MAG: hypothetical protein GF335_01590 [Candidatus Moranbacteria bacterium]|nr:hypothetical protein [Candidatus Moranbacteria bacterium]
MANQESGSEIYRHFRDIYKKALHKARKVKGLEAKREQYNNLEGLDFREDLYDDDGILEIYERALKGVDKDCLENRGDYEISLQKMNKNLNNCRMKR